MRVSPQELRALQRTYAVLHGISAEASAQALLLPGSCAPQGNLIVFTGSFNPPTIAHLALLKQAQSYALQHPPMQLYTAFTMRTVDKEHVERPLLLDRIVLLQQLLRRRLPHTGLLVFNRGLYVEQARALRHSFPRVQRILFLMGFDKIVQILDPRYYTDRDQALQELFSQAELLVAPREQAGEQELHMLLQAEQNQAYAGFIHPITLGNQYRDISSTHIRQGTSTHRQHIPHEVRHFMRRTQAYNTTSAAYEARLHDLRIHLGPL